MSAEVTVGVEEIENVLKLPVHAVMEAGGKKFCYVKPEKGEPQKRELKTGLNNNKFIELLPDSDVKEGDLVIVNSRTLAERRGDLQADYKDPGEGLQDNNGKPRRKNPDKNGAGAVSPGGAPRGPGGPQGGPVAKPGGGPVGPGGMGPGGPAGPGAGPGGPGGPGFQMTDEMRERQKKFDEELRKAAPAKRKQLIEDLPVPAEMKETIKKRYKDQGVEIPN